MSNSLQDQLVQAGLADPAQARKEPAKRGPQNKGKGKGKGNQGKGRGGQAKGRRRDPGKERAGSGQGDPARAPKQKGGGASSTDAAEQPPRNAREALARIRKIVAAERLPREQADTPYRFTSGSRIKEITVTADQQRQLASGEAGIVNVQGRYDVLPRAGVERVRALDEKTVVVLNQPDAQASESSAEDDPYADRPVPDDLMW